MPLTHGEVNHLVLQLASLSAPKVSKAFKVWVVKSFWAHISMRACSI